MSKRISALILCALGGGCDPNPKQNPVIVSGASPAIGEESTADNSPLEPKKPGSGPLTPPTVPTGINCPLNWTQVAGDREFQTTDFCVMKFEAREVDNIPASQAGGRPRVSGSAQDAKVACAALGEGYGMINNNDWMSLASQVAQNAVNWYGDRGQGFGFGTAGESIKPSDIVNYRLVLIRGHTDHNPANACESTQEMVDTDCGNSGKEDDPTEKRLFKLVNGGEIWDLGGNVWEWVDYYNLDTKPYSIADGGPVGAYREFPAIDAGFEKMPKAQLVPHKKDFWINSFNSEQGVGGYYSGLNQSGGSLMRGGFWNDEKRAGIFFADLARGPASVDTYIGYRCVKRK